MDIQKYFDKASLLSLLMDIEMPPEVSEKILEISSRIDTQSIAPEFEELFNPANAQCAVEKLEGALNRFSQDGFGILAVMLAAALRTKEFYKQKNIPENIFIDTMKCFSRFVREELKISGKLCFRRSFWTWRQTDGIIFRLGTLEFEYKKLEEDLPAEASVKKGADIISVHIPSDAVLTKEALRASYQRIVSFFKPPLFPCPPEAVICRTWLLSPELRNMLPEGSGILTFQKDYRIIALQPDSDEYNFWLFDVREAALADLPEKTSLQRKAKAHLLNGGKIGTATGILQDWR